MHMIIQYLYCRVLSNWIIPPNSDRSLRPGSFVVFFGKPCPILLRRLVAEPIIPVPLVRVVKRLFFVSLSRLII
jgi:hypothetical protein